MNVMKILPKDRCGGPLRGENSLFKLEEGTIVIVIVIKSGGY